jgi:hypothetical protein
MQTSLTKLHQGQIFGNDSNKSKLYSQINSEQTELSMLVTIQFRMFCHYVSHLKMQTLKYTNILIFLKSNIFWDITPCSQLKVNRRFGRTYTLHLLGGRINRARNQRESLLRTCFHALFLLRLFFDPEGGDMFLRNVCWPSTDYTALYPRRQYSS